MQSPVIGEDGLAAIWRRHLGLGTVDRDDDFFAIGGTSLQAAQMLLDVEEATGMRLPVTVLLDAPTVRELARYIHGERRANSGSLILLKAGAGGLPLFLIHPVGGSVLVYRELAQAMSVPGSIYGIQAAGLRGEEPIHTRVEDMARHYGSEILRVQPVGPYRLAGYSAGGIVAFATAQHLVAAHKEVGFVGLINTHFPFRRIDRQVGWMRRLPAYLRYAGERGLSRAAREFLGNWRYRRKLTRAEALLDARGSTFDERHRKLVAATLDSHRGRSGERYALVRHLHQIAIKYYQPGIYRGAIHLYRTADYHENRPGEIGWPRFAGGKIRARRVSGTHLTLVHDGHAAALAALLSRDLESSGFDR